MKMTTPPTHPTAPETAHTPEPWYHDPSDAEGRTVSAAPDGSGAIAECGLEYSTLARNPGRANAKRIISCVNAFAGVADPAAELARLRAEIASLNEEVAIDDKLLADRQRILDAVPCPDHGPCVPHVLKEFERLRASEARLRTALEVICKNP